MKLHNYSYFRHSNNCHENWRILFDDKEITVLLSFVWSESCLLQPCDDVVYDSDNKTTDNKDFTIINVCNSNGV